MGVTLRFGTTCKLVPQYDRVCMYRGSLRGGTQFVKGFK